MTFSRRMVLAGATLLAAGEGADACSLVVSPRPVSFSDAACRRSLRALVETINKAPGMSEATLRERVEDQSVTFSSDVVDQIYNYAERGPFDEVDLLREWTRSEGKPDRRPLRLTETNLLKADRGIALYQFTLTREQFYREVTEEEASGDSCQMPEAAHYSITQRSYLGEFKNNRLRDVSAFEAWLRKL